MHQTHIVIIGGGLSGLSAGCYALASGFRVTILEHADALGGVCTAWERGPYTIDGCIHWLTGGPFEALYTELGILPRVALRPLASLAHYHDVSDGIAVAITRDLDELAFTLGAISPVDAAEVRLLIETAREVVAVEPNIAQPRELNSLSSELATLWHTRHLTKHVAHLRKPLSTYAAEHIQSTVLRRLLTRLFPEDSSALFLAMMLGHLELGQLSRPAGGTAPFRDALIASYRSRGGAVRLQSTVDEILIERGHARGVRLTDGTLVEADYVVSTSSVPETVLHLLGGRYGLAQHAAKLEDWKLFDPLLLVSFGVALPLPDLAGILVLDRVPKFHVGGRAGDHLHLRVFNDEPSFAPAGHTVIQALLSSEYEYWATRRERYAHAKEQIGEAVLEAIDGQIPGVQSATCVRDVATPLTYWRTARSWRGAYEGWRPRRQSLFSDFDKRIDGLKNFYLAGQWVEPGGGIPVSLLSGKQAIQLLCADARRPFVSGLQP